MPPMTLDYLTWEAFSTLLAGALAVGAAIYVGRRQTEIQSKQVLIQNRLAHLEELKLRQALFDARYQVYNASRKWLVATLQQGAPPFSSANLEGAQRDAQLKWADEFLDAVDRSRFLFGPAVRDVLFQMWQAGEALIQMDKVLARSNTSPEQREKAAQKHDEAFKFLSGLLPDFSDLFGDELILSASSKRESE